MWSTQVVVQVHICMPHAMCYLVEDIPAFQLSPLLTSADLESLMKVAVMVRTLRALSCAILICTSHHPSHDTAAALHTSSGNMFICIHSHHSQDAVAALHTFVYIGYAHLWTPL